MGDAVMEHAAGMRDDLNVGPTKAFNDGLNEGLRRGRAEAARELNNAQSLATILAAAAQLGKAPPQRFIDEALALKPSLSASPNLTSEGRPRVRLSWWRGYDSGDLTPFEARALAAELEREWRKKAAHLASDLEGEKSRADAFEAELRSTGAKLREELAHREAECGRLNAQLAKALEELTKVQREADDLRGSWLQVEEDKAEFDQLSDRLVKAEARHAELAEKFDRLHKV